jgi:LemA protein
MKRGLGVVIGILVVIGIAVALILGSYVSAKNQMVSKDEGVKAAWSQVDVVLQRRADLIPNLVETVKGYAKHEETVFGDIANARAGLLNARDPQQKIQANGQLDSALGRLLALSENYPDLKANQNFLSLQDQLEGSENRIAVERRRYNETLRDYNTFWANIAGFHPNNAYFEATPASRTAPTVKF